MWYRLTTYTYVHSGDQSTETLFTPGSGLASSIAPYLRGQINTDVSLPLWVGAKLSWD